MGTVFTLKTDGTGYTILHSFAGAPSDGARPNAALVLDAAGNLYGTTWGGGSQPCVPSGCGTVFTLATDGTGFMILHNFFSFDGAAPIAGLILDAAGNLYGTTWGGGSAGGLGTVFTLATDGTGFMILHNFGGGASDGSRPIAGLMLDAAGNLYGTTQEGGSGPCFSSGCGTVFTLATDGTGYTILHSFAGAPSDGANPLAGLAIDDTGNLYGTTQFGGSGTVCGLNGCGTVFMLP